MINAKVKIFSKDNHSSLENEIKLFLETIDIRQIIKTEYSSGIAKGPYGSEKLFSTIIYYVNFEDIRDVKIDNVLNLSKF